MKKKIMVVDDVADTVEVVEVVLEADGFEVMSFTNAKEALKALEGGTKPDLLLLDMRMPEISGPDFAEKIRANAKLKDLKIVFFTASSDSDQNLLKKYKILGFIYKPFDVHELVKQVTEFLKKK